MQKYTAIILASRDTNEFDRIYFLYTREAGLVRVAGKGVRKSTAKLAGHLEPGTMSEVYVARSRGRGQITSAITLENFDNIKKDFRKLSEFLEISRFFLKNFSEEEKDERIFELLHEFLINLENRESRGDAGKILVEAFWWKLFDVLGHRPEVMRCAVCADLLRANSKKYFSAEKGAAICGNCGPKIRDLMPVSDNQIKLMRIFWGNPLDKILKVKANETELEKLAKIRENFRRFNFQSNSLPFRRK